MAFSFGRLRRLIRRYRVDGRLPPDVFRLTVDANRLRLTDRLDRLLARLQPVIRPAGPATAGVVRWGRRRIGTIGAVDDSLSVVAHRHARAVLDAFDRRGIEGFAVQRDGDTVVLGILLAQRDAALDALADDLSEGWLLRWARGARHGTVATRAAATSRHARNAREWRVGQPLRWGDRVGAVDQWAVVTFWEPGASGQLEMVGTRGQQRFDPRTEPTTEIVDGRRYPGRAAFPVGRDLEHFDGPIDLVYTWVDGSDPAWQERFRATATQLGRRIDEAALDPARYRSRDELRYSLRSVWAFCGWARQIYVVTAGQRPAWLVDDDRVRIVDHSEILPGDALPTFNSHALESSLHHIDGLSEHFVYFNDDMFVGRSVRPEMFFTPNGLPRVFHSDARVPAVEDADTLAVDTAARRGRELLAERFGRVASFKPLHSPYPLLRSVLEEIEVEYSDIVKATARSRFRAPTDLSIAASFAQHYALATGRAVPGDIMAEYVHVESGRLGWHLDRLRLGRGFDTFCINETEHTARDAAARERSIAAFLEEYFPVPAPWEADR